MKHKKIRIKGLFTAILFISTSLSLNAQSSEKYKIDAGKSLLQWSAQKVTGSHRGLINVKNGYLLMSANSLKGGTVFIDMNSIRNLDIEDAEDKKKLENHLKSKDFFNSKEYPEAIFKVYQIKELKDNEKYTHTLSGSLTIKGYTNKLIFPVNVEVKNNKVTIKGSASVDRTLYDIKYRSGKFYDDLGDLLIYDNFNIDFTLVGTKKSEKE